MNLEQLTAIEEIKQLKARYLRCMDTKDWDGLRRVFADDATLDVRGGVSDEKGQAADSSMETGDIIRGLDQVVAFMSKNLTPLKCAHYAHMPEISLHSPTSARGVWSQHDYLYFPEGAPNRVLRGFGYYHETYERVDSRWVIKTLKLTRLFLDLE